MNKRCLASFLLLLFFSFPGQSQTLNNWVQDISPDANLQFRNGQITFTEFGSPPASYQTDFTEINADGILFVGFDYSFTFQNAEYLNPFFPEGQQNWLVLFSSGYLFAYREATKLPIANGFMGRNSYSLISDAVYRSESYLIEGSTHYSPANLGNLALDAPWVEGASDSGIGSVITITSSQRSMGSLLFSNGYVSYEKPYLYSANNRVKQIRITDSENTIDLLVDLADTPQLQRIDLGGEARELFIEILAVYEGERWDDTCIHFILPLDY